MGDGTGIEWTDATWNPIRGCSRVSEGCRNCYAERVANRYSGEGLPYEGLAANGKWTGKVIVVESHMEDPIRWKKPRRIFVNSMSDLFHEELPFEQVARIFCVMAAAPQHTFQVLTKRPARMLAFFEWCKTHSLTVALSAPLPKVMQWPLPNVGIGVTAEDQRAAEYRIPILLEVPAAWRFVSIEPMIGPVRLRHIDADKAGHRYCQLDALTGKHTDMGRPCEPLPKLDWVICGGESGPGARPMAMEWARSLRDQCLVTGVPFFFKQWGDHDQVGERVGKRAAGSMLDDRQHKEFPR